MDGSHLTLVQAQNPAYDPLPPLWGQVGILSAWLMKDRGWDRQCSIKGVARRVDDPNVRYFA